MSLNIEYRYLLEHPVCDIQSDYEMMLKSNGENDTTVKLYSRALKFLARINNYQKTRARKFDC